MWSGMTSHLFALCFDANDPSGLARFWAGVLGWEIADDAHDVIALSFDANDPSGLARYWSGVLGWELADDPHDGVTLLPGDDSGFRIRFVQTQEQ
jgi:hypothetical protein